LDGLFARIGRWLSSSASVARPTGHEHLAYFSRIRYLQPVEPQLAWNPEEAEEPQKAE
jgi:hypothetical protein